jgi:sugar lactone lactonase YvrE
MNLHDALEQVGREADALLVPAVSDVRARGDDLRHRARRRTALLAAAAVAVAGVTAYAVASSGIKHDIRPAKEHEWGIVGTYEVPRFGLMATVDGDLWVEDTHNRRMNADRTAPLCEVLVVDPATGQFKESIKGACGGWPLVAAGALWLEPGINGFRPLVRVDLDTHEVRYLTVQHDKASSLQGSVYADGSIWVASSWEYDVLRIDPESLEVTARIHTRPVTRGEPGKTAVFFDGSVWFTVNSERQLVRIDPTTNRVVSVVDLDMGPDEYPSQLLVAGNHLYSLSQSAIYEVDASQTGHERVRSLRLRDSVDEDGAIESAKVGLGAIWVSERNPDRVYRIDPETLEVTDTVSLPPVTDRSPQDSIDLLVGDDGVWVRTEGNLMEISQQTGQD